MARRDRKTGAFLSQPQVEELQTIEDFKHAMAFIQQQDKIDNDDYVAKYQKLARERDITLPGRINALIERDQNSRADIFSTMAPICRAATMSFIVDKRGNKIPDDVALICEQLRSFANRLEKSISFFGTLTQDGSLPKQTVQWFKKSPAVSPAGLEGTGLNEDEAKTLLDRNDIKFFSTMDLFSCSYEWIEEMEAKSPKILRVAEMAKKASQGMTNPLNLEEDEPRSRYPIKEEEDYKGEERGRRHDEGHIERSRRTRQDSDAASDRSQVAPTHSSGHRESTTQDIYSRAITPQGQRAQSPPSAPARRGRPSLSPYLEPPSRAITPGRRERFSSPGLAEATALDGSLDDVESPLNNSQEPLSPKDGISSDEDVQEGEEEDGQEHLGLHKSRG